MPVELDTEFLGLWLDEELLRAEFDAIIEAGWADEPTDRPVIRRWAPLPHRTSPGPGHRHDGHSRRPTDRAEPGTAPARERGPPRSG